MFDRSDSMFTENAKPKRWDPAVAAMTLFFEDAQSTGLEASLTYFPEGFNGAEECAPATYERSHVPLATLPSPAFAASLSEQTGRKNSTPTRAALTGAIAQAKAVQAQRPGTRTAIVFITDGHPRTCGVGDEEGDKMELTLSEAAAREAAAEYPTFVVGVGANLTAFHGLAQAGGTERATLVDDTQNPEAVRDAFREALGLVRAPESAASDPRARRQALAVDMVNVVFAGRQEAAARPRVRLGRLAYDDRPNPRVSISARRRATKSAPVRAAYRHRVRLRTGQPQVAAAASASAGTGHRQQRRRVRPPPRPTSSRHYPPDADTARRGEVRVQARPRLPPRALERAHPVLSLRCGRVVA